MCAGVWLLAALWLAASGAAAAPAVPEALPGAPPFPAALRERLASQLAQRPAGWEPRTRHRRPDGSPLYTNRLALEASPYLLQHAHNPVNWYAWGDEAFEVARELGRPVLVSIGYSTCHWCHVMEEQSFDDVETAELLNRFFVAVKVDRETRPDVDAIYMSALQAMGQRGGWPLNVWLTPDRQPFFGGTYFPPEDMPGRPGFRRVLRELHEVWSGDPARLERQALGLSRAIARQLEGAVVHSTQLPHESMLQGVVEAYAERFDPTWGGVRTHTKFPSALPVRLLLRIHRRGGDPRALSMTTLTLAQMAAGGLRDHLGGGFHRYTTEPRWLVPHFEKMLYDNALLAVAYLEGWQVTGREDFAEVARETLDYVAREMTDASGGFHSATDADSAGPDGELEEGRFFTWTPAELVGVLGADAPVVAEVYGVSNGGDLEGRSVLRRWEPLDAVAARHDLSAEELDEKIARARERLYRARAERPPPLLDDKIITSWNGLMISAFARAALAFDAPDYAETARRAADHLLASRRDGRLPRVTRQGQSSGPAFLEDYAFLIAGLLDLYEALPDPRWIREAQALQEKLDAHHGRPEAGAYYRSAGDGERLLAREKPARDGAVPSGNSVAAENLLRLAAITGEERYREQALGIFSDLHAPLSGDPAGVSELLIAVDHALDTGKEVLLVAPPGGDLSPLLDVLRRRFVPNRTLSAVNEGAQLEAHAAVVPLLRHKKARSGKVTAYVCENRVCRFPTSDPAELAKQLDVVKPLAPPPGPDA